MKSFPSDRVEDRVGQFRPRLLDERDAEFEAEEPRAFGDQRGERGRDVVQGESTETRSDQCEERFELRPWGVHVRETLLAELRQRGWAFVDDEEVRWGWEVDLRGGVEEVSEWTRVKE